MEEVEHSVQTLMSVISLPAVKAVLGPVEIHAAVDAIKVLAAAATKHGDTGDQKP